MKGIIDEYADAKAAARNRVLADERLKLVCEIAQLRAALKEAAEVMDGEGLAAADGAWGALGIAPPHTQRREG